MTRIIIALLAVAFILLPSGSSASVYVSRSMSLKVYSDGYVLVAQTLAVDSKATSVQVPLISPAVSNLVATDQNGSPLSYGFSSGGGNITVYTLGATEITVKYDTGTLTAKNGTVWTLAFSTRFNSTVILPQNSTLGSVPGNPYSLSQTQGYPEMTLPPGSWRISYGVPLGATTSTTGTGTSTTNTGSVGGVTQGGAVGLTTLQLEEVGLVAAGVAVGGLALRWWRKEGLGPVSRDLRPDDLQVLNFIRDKGGKVLEPEIRMNFALPKTSAWRQIKRLERLGYVRVTKIGSQNQIEILKERNSGT